MAKEAAVRIRAVFPNDILWMYPKPKIMAQIQLYALKNDLLRVFEAAEAKRPLKYIRASRYPTQHCDCYSHGSEIPDLGTAFSDASVRANCFLVCEPDLRIKFDAVEESPTTVTFDVDQLLNPDTITIWPGGLWRDEMVIHGSLSTASDTRISRLLMGRFRTVIRKFFTNVRGVYVGEEALRLLKAGKRLTIGTHSARDFDLRLE